MKYYWTRFLARYPKMLVYMLQASEYRLNDYVNWLNRTSDFRRVMKRVQLDYTTKAKFLLVLAYAILFGSYLKAILLAVQSIYRGDLLLLIIAALIFLLSPLALSYVILVPLWLGEILIQKPSEKRLINNAHEIIARHPGLKIAIAGSYGKTSAKEILATVLSQSKKVAFTPGNMNTAIGISRFAKQLNSDEDVIIFELGEWKVGDIRELSELTKPDMGIITGINEAHLESFGTIDHTIATIFELQDYLGDKPLYKNKEDELVSAKVSDNDKLAYSRKGVNGWVIGSIKTDITGTSFRAKKGKKVVNVHTALLGEHNVGIIAAVIDIAESLGLTTKQIEDGLSSLTPYEHRMQPRVLNGAWIIDDTYNGNSEGVTAGLKLLKKLDARRRVYVTPGLVEQGEKTHVVHERIGHQIAEVADVVVLMNNSVLQYIQNGLNEGGFKGRLITIDDPLEFYKNLDQFVAVGDVVMMQNDWPDNFA